LFVRADFMVAAPMERLFCHGAGGFLLFLF
jgi:hypothetical protein